jgi:hypothetical protein
MVLLTEQPVETHQVSSRSFADCSRGFFPVRVPIDNRFNRLWGVLYHKHIKSHFLETFLKI